MYHAPVGLRTSPRTLLLCLSPPGNIRRELALYRRALFAAGWPSSTLALPEVAILGRPTSPKGLRARAGAILARLEGSFCATGPDSFEPAGPGLGEGLYAPLGGCYFTLLEDLSAELEGLPPFRPEGIFLGLGPQAKPGSLPPPPPLPRLGFHSADILLLELWGLDADLQALAWKEEFRIHRPRAVTSL